MIRTHEAGTLRAAQAGERVTLAGWVARRRDHGGVTFVDLRDASGIVQVVLREEDVAHELRAEYCVLVTGRVRRRPAGNENPELATGELEVLSACDPLPFPLDGSGELNEEVRLRYRYLDLRRPEMAAAIRARSRAAYLVSDLMARLGFVNVETPFLTRSTPEGARDFVVPVRLRPGSWYALPQSPQLFKQLLMVAGLERYYQLVRCFRDEDFRADRQPEFTQVDLEMSFVTRDDVIEVAEELVRLLWREIAGHEVATPIPRMTYAEAMSRFGSDKPDLRFGCELRDLTAYFAGTAFRVFQAPHVGAVVMPGGAAQSRRELDGWQEWARSRGAKGLAYVLVRADGAVADAGPVARHLSDAERAGRAGGHRASAARGRPAGDRRAVRADRPCGMGVHVGSRCADVRGGRRGRLDRGPPSVHRAAAGVGRQVRLRPGRGAGRRLRHRLQRDRDRRGVHPDPPPRPAAAGLRRDRPVPRGGEPPVRLPPRRAALRAAPARRDRVRLGPDAHAPHRAPVDQGRHRVPQGRLRIRPADRGADPDHGRPAPGGRGRRGAGAGPGASGQGRARLALRRRGRRGPRRRVPSNTCPRRARASAPASSTPPRRTPRGRSPRSRSGCGRAASTRCSASRT